MIFFSAPLNASGDRGFVLVFVLGFLVIVSLGLAYLASVLDQGMARSIEVDLRFRASLDELATEQTVLYLLATRDKSFKGLNIDRPVGNDQRKLSPFLSTKYDPVDPSIDFTGKHYLGVGSCKYSVEDSSSLVSLRSKTLGELQKLLISLGKSASDSQRMINVLQDYTDRDDDMRMLGGEKASYGIMKDAPFPRNRFLSNPRELLNVKGWKDSLSDSAFQVVFAEVSPHVADQLNFNTMTERRIKWLAINSFASDKIIDSRKTGYFASRKDLKPYSSLFDKDSILRAAFLPSKNFKLNFSCDEMPIKAEMGVTMTPRSSIKPWEIDYRLHLPTTDRSNARYQQNKKIGEEEALKRHNIFSG